MSALSCHDDHPKPPSVPIGTDCTLPVQAGGYPDGLRAEEIPLAAHRGLLRCATTR